MDSNQPPNNSYKIALKSGMQMATASIFIFLCVGVVAGYFRLFDLSVFPGVSEISKFLLGGDTIGAFFIWALAAAMVVGISIGLGTFIYQKYVNPFTMKLAAQMMNKPNRNAWNNKQTPNQNNTDLHLSPVSEESKKENKEQIDNDNKITPPTTPIESSNIDYRDIAYLDSYEYIQLKEHLEKFKNAIRKCVSNKTLSKDMIETNRVRTMESTLCKTSNFREKGSIENLKKQLDHFSKEIYDYKPNNEAKHNCLNEIMGDLFNQPIEVLNEFTTTYKNSNQDIKTTIKTLMDNHKVHDNPTPPRFTFVTEIKNK